MLFRLLGIKDKRAIGFFYKFKLAPLIYSAMTANVNLIEKFLNFRDAIDFVPKDLVATLLRFFDFETNVPSLSSIFEAAHKNMKRLLKAVADSDLSETVTLPYIPPIPIKFLEDF